ncbi:MAG: sigma-70 family RNA polymerase sigma factor [Pirellulales bacterium]|nr:sigma-70 family RNA polymerase sigma factor [Pirellulales bacterium]
MADASRQDQFLELLSQHQAQLTGYVYALVQNMQDTEDILQQTMLVLWKKFDSFEPGTSFIGWAMQIAKYEIYHLARSRRRSLVVFDETLAAKLAQQHFAEAEPDSQRGDALRTCVGKLEPNDRKLIDECYSTSRTLTQIAASLGRSVQSLSNSLTRIRRRLMECIDRELRREERS